MGAEFLPVRSSSQGGMSSMRGAAQCGGSMGHLLRTMLLTAVVLLCYVHPSSGYETNEFCRWETFNATCPQNTAILMRTARYGRMQRGRCLARDYYLGCAADVLIHADSRCSGRHECSIGVPDATLHEVQPCPKDIMAYLEAGYECVPVASGDGRPCQSYKPLELTRDSGYIASVVTEDEGYGTSYCPWIIKVKQGQQINMTLYDFSLLTFNQDSPICQVYATIKERTRTRDVTVCGGGQRTRHLMLSDTNTLEVQMVSHAAQGARPYFLLKYEAVGCPDVSPPLGGWAVRRAESLVVGCNGTTLKWHLVCKGSRWVGDIRNCSKDAQTWTLGQTWSDGGGFPYGLLISVAIGVILGIVLGTVMLAMVLICRRRRHQRKEVKTQALLTKQNTQLPVPGRPVSHPVGTDRNNYPSTLEKNSTLTGGGNSGKNGGYAHIWELRQNSLPNTAMEQGGMMDTLEGNRRGTNKRQESMGGDYNSRTAPGMLYSQQQQLQRDHVYESPKPPRREEGIYHASGVPYYHEFDPSDAEGSDGDFRFSTGEMQHTRSNNMRGTTFSLGDD